MSRLDQGGLISMHTEPTGHIDARFSDPDAGVTPWADVAEALDGAELYWITTVREDGRPHVTPLIGVVHDGAPHFCTGLREQKYRNLEHSGQVALTTGNNTWDRGLDVVVEGRAVRVAGNDVLQHVADAYVDKYGEVWRFEVREGVFGQGDMAAGVFRIEPSKVLAFAKDPHGQTTFRFAAR